MPKMIFVNLPVSDVARSVTFYEAIGARKDERFCRGDTAAMMVFSDTISFMLLSHDHFRQFTTKAIVDTGSSTEVLICFSETSREAVDATADTAIKAGGRKDPCPRQDHGFMYGRSFEDPDGHILEVVWMDVEAAIAATDSAPASAA